VTNSVYINTVTCLIRSMKRSERRLHASRDCICYVNSTHYLITELTGLSNRINATRAPKTLMSAENTITLFETQLEEHNFVPCMHGVFGQRMSASTVTTTRCDWYSVARRWWEDVKSSWPTSQSLLQLFLPPSICVWHVCAVCCSTLHWFTVTESFW
jgi:hypothetical protein